MQQIRQWIVTVGLIAVLGVVGSIILVGLSPDPTPPVIATQIPPVGSGSDSGIVPFGEPGAGGDANLIPAPAATIAPPPTPAPRQHTVVSGDTLFNIAQQYGTTIEAIVRANNLSDPNRLEIGQVLILPSE